MLSAASLRISLGYNQVQRDDEEQQLLDTYVKDTPDTRPISTRKLTQQRLREASFVDAEQRNSVTGAGRPPSLASLALAVFARNFPRLLRVTQADDAEGQQGSPDTDSKAAAGTTTSARAGKGTKPVHAAGLEAAGQRKSSRVAAVLTSKNRSASARPLIAGADGRPSEELSRRTHERLRLLPAQHLAALQVLLQKHHRRALTKLTLRRYFLPPTNARLHLSPAIPLITENPDSGPLQLLSAATMHARTLTHASLVALNRTDAKFFAKFAIQASNLEYLDLSACVNANASAIRELAKAYRNEGKPSRLRYLNLDATAVGATGVAVAIASFLQLEVLKAANVQGLDDSALSEAILTAISAEADAHPTSSDLRPLRQLRSLKLRRTTVGNQALALILDMCDPALLHTLDIGFTHCSLEGLLDAIAAPSPPPLPSASQDHSHRLLELALLAESEDGRHGSPFAGAESGSAGGAPSSLLTPLDAGSPAASSSQPLFRLSELAAVSALAGSEQAAPPPPPPYQAKFNFRKLNLSALYMHSGRGSTESRLQPLRNLLSTQTQLRSLYLQRVPHFGYEYDLVQELTGVLRVGLSNILEIRRKQEGFATPLFKKLRLSSNQALGTRVQEARQRGGWYYAYQIHEQEEAAAGELGKLMREIGIYCEEVQLSYVSLLPSHIAFSRYQRVLELDHTGIEDTTIIGALQRAGMIASADDGAGEADAAQDPIEEQPSTGRTRSGRGAPSTMPKKRNSKGKAKATDDEAKPKLVTGNLRRISLVDAKVSDESLRPLLEANPFLQEVDLTSCRSIAVTQRRNYFEHIFGDEESDTENDDGGSASDADSYEAHRRKAKLNPYRSNSDRRAAIARRQAASGTTLTRQEMIDDDFIIDEDSDYDEYGSSRRKRPRSTSASPRKRSTSSASPSKRRASAASQHQPPRRSEAEILQAVKSAKTARLAAAARLQTAGVLRPTQSSRRASHRGSNSRGPSGSSAKSLSRRFVNDNTSDSDSDEEDDESELSGTDTSEDEDENEDDNDSDDERPLSQRKPKRRRLVTDGPGAPLTRRRRPKRSAARNLSLVDEYPFLDDEEHDPDFRIASSRGAGGRSPSKAAARGSDAEGAGPSHLRRSSSGAAAAASPFASVSTSTSRTPDGTTRGAAQHSAAAARRRSASPTRSPSTRVRELAARATEAARESRARARELAAEEEQAARAARAARRAKDGDA